MNSTRDTTYGYNYNPFDLALFGPFSIGARDATKVRANFDNRIVQDRRGRLTKLPAPTYLTEDKWAKAARQRIHDQGFLMPYEIQDALHSGDTSPIGEHLLGVGLGLGAAGQAVPGSHSNPITERLNFTGASNAIDILRSPGGPLAPSQEMARLPGTGPSAPRLGGTNPFFGPGAADPNDLSAAINRDAPPGLPSFRRFVNDLPNRALPNFSLLNNAPRPTDINSYAYGPDLQSMLGVSRGYPGSTTQGTPTNLDHPAAPLTDRDALLRFANLMERRPDPLRSFLDRASGGIAAGPPLAGFDPHPSPSRNPFTGPSQGNYKPSPFEPTTNYPFSNRLFHFTLDALEGRGDFETVPPPAPGPTALDQAVTDLNLPRDPASASPFDMPYGANFRTAPQAKQFLGNPFALEDPVKPFNQPHPLEATPFGRLNDTGLNPFGILGPHPDIARSGPPMSPFGSMKTPNPLAWPFAGDNPNATSNLFPNPAHEPGRFVQGHLSEQPGGMRYTDPFNDRPYTDDEVSPIETWRSGGFPEGAWRPPSAGRFEENEAARARQLREFQDWLRQSSPTRSLGGYSQPIFPGGPQDVVDPTSPRSTMMGTYPNIVYKASRLHLPPGRDPLVRFLPQELQALQDALTVTTKDPRTGRRIETGLPARRPGGAYQPHDFDLNERVPSPEGTINEPKSRWLYPPGGNPDAYRTGEGELWGTAYETYFDKATGTRRETPDAKANNPRQKWVEYRTPDGKLHKKGEHLFPVGSQTVKGVRFPPDHTFTAADFASATRAGAVLRQNTDPSSKGGTYARMYEPLKRGGQRAPGDIQPDGSFHLDLSFPITAEAIQARGGPTRVMHLDQPLPPEAAAQIMPFLTRHRLTPDTPARRILQTMRKDFSDIPDNRTALEYILDLTKSEFARDKDPYGRSFLVVPPRPRRHHKRQPPPKTEALREPDPSDPGPNTPVSAPSWDAPPPLRRSPGMHSTINFSPAISPKRWVAPTTEGEVMDNLRDLRTALSLGRRFVPTFVKDSYVRPDVRGVLHYFGGSGEPTDLGLNRVPYGTVGGVHPHTTRDLRAELHASRMVKEHLPHISRGLLSPVVGTGIYGTTMGKGFWDPVSKSFVDDYRFYPPTSGLLDKLPAGKPEYYKALISDLRNALRGHGFDGMGDLSKDLLFTGQGTPFLLQFRPPGFTDGPYLEAPGGRLHNLLVARRDNRRYTRKYTPEENSFLDELHSLDPEDY